MSKPAQHIHSFDGLNIIEARHKGAHQIDDEDMVFSKYPAADMTKFFRDPEVRAFQKIMDELSATLGRKKLLSLPSSIGCEAYSLAAMFQERAASGAELEIVFADISQKKIDAAIGGVYPKFFAHDIPETYQKYFSVRDEFLHVSDGLKSMVSPLPAANVLDMDLAAQEYDAVIATNFLYYLGSRENRVAAAQKLAMSTKSVLCLSHGVRRSFEADGRAVKDAVIEQGFQEASDYYEMYDPYVAQIFVRQP